MNILPILLLGGTATLVLTGKKKKKKSPPVPTPAVTQEVGLERWGSVRTPGSMELAAGQQLHTLLGDDLLITAVGSSNPEIVSITTDQPGAPTSMVMFKALQPGKSTLTVQCQDGTVLVSDATVT